MTNAGDVILRTKEPRNQISRSYAVNLPVCPRSSLIHNNILPFRFRQMSLFRYSIIVQYTLAGIYFSSGWCCLTQP